MIALLPALALQAAPPNPDWNCADPQFQQEMNWCAGQDFASSDAAMNVQWALTRAAMQRRDADYARYKDKSDTRPGWFASLLEAQRAWLRYRDAHCRVDGYTARGGSMEPLLTLTCKTQLTNLRTQELKELAESPN